MPTRKAARTRKGTARSVSRAPARITRPARDARRQPTLLLLGSGELGKEFVICAKRLGCRVVAVDRYDDAPPCRWPTGGR